MTLVQPGWYPDPAHPGLLRRWDGDHWTDETRPAPTPKASDAYAVAPVPTGPQVRADEAGFIAATVAARAKGLTLDLLILLIPQALCVLLYLQASGWQWTLDMGTLDPSDPTLVSRLVSRVGDAITVPLQAFAIVSFLTTFLYFQVGLMRTGRTLGGQRFGIRCVTVTGAHPSYLQAAVRYLIWGVPTLITSWPGVPMTFAGIMWLALFANYGAAYVDPNHRALMDRWSGTYVIRG